MATTNGKQRLFAQKTVLLDSMKTISIPIQSSTALSVNTVILDALIVIDMQSTAQSAKELKPPFQTQTQAIFSQTTQHGVNV
jgi:hypothetical protein